MPESAQGKPLHGMFTAVTPRYDLINRLITLGLDQRWRRAAAPACLAESPIRVLDIACGTGDLIQRMSKKKRTFYGCNRYPECKFAVNARPVPQPCPACGGLMTVYGKNQARCIKCSHKEKLAENEIKLAVAAG